MKVLLEHRIAALAAIAAGQSVRDAAREHGVTVRTIQSWRRWLQQGGARRLEQRRAIEHSVYLVKERSPGCTLKQARCSLSVDEITLSERSIWKIWRKHGLAGYKKCGGTASHLTYIHDSPNLRPVVSQAERLLKSGDITAAADIVNKLPVCVKAEILLEIPDELLTLRRRLDKLYPLSDRVPLAQSRHKARQLRRELMARGLNYSGLRAAVLELKNLLLMGKLRDGIALMKRVEHLIPDQGDPALKFVFLYTKAQLLSRSMEYGRAAKCIAACQVLSRNLRSPFFAFSLGAIHCELGNYCKAIGIIEQLLPELREPYRTKALQDLAIMHDITGRHAEALNLMPKPENQNAPMAYHQMKIQARHSLAQGHVKESIELTYRTLRQPGCLRSVPALFPVVNDLYCLYAGLGQSADQRERLARISELCRKEGSVLSYYLGSVLLGKPVHIPAQARQHPLLRVCLCLREAQEQRHLKPYREARRIAGRFGLWGRLQLFCLVFPWPVRALLRIGRATGLPKAMQQLPVFNQEKPVVKLRLLGRPQLHRDGKPLRGHLHPKDAALLIHLALSPGQELPVDKALVNFWPTAEAPHNDLSHALMRLRRVLKIPSHLLSIRDDKLRADFHVLTDYGEWSETVTLAQACAVAGKDDLASSEWLKAFALLRGAPFRGMYDDWSDEKRNAIVLDFERKALAFVKGALQRGNLKIARRVLKKLLQIEPQSDEAALLLHDIATKQKGRK